MFGSRGSMWPQFPFLDSPNATDSDLGDRTSHLYR